MLLLEGGRWRAREEVACVVSRIGILPSQRKVPLDPRLRHLIGCSVAFWTASGPVTRQFTVQFGNVKARCGGRRSAQLMDKFCRPAADEK